MPTRMAKAFSQEAAEFGSQMGCIASMFHILDRRRRLLTGRRHGDDCPATSTMNQLPPAGHTLPVSSSTHAPVQSTANLNNTMEKSFRKSKSKSMTENSTLSTEAPRASSASSSCYSLSPLDSSKPVQKKVPCSNEKPVVGNSKTMRSSRSLKPSDTEVKSKQQKSDFRDVVKDSINLDSRVLAIKTKMMEQRNGLHKDSPRPLLISKSTDGTYVIAIDRSNVPPAYVNESSSRPRLSCDDRQLLLQVEAQDSKMTSSNHLELPRLSLDSRNESLKSSLSLKKFSYADDSLIDNLKYKESLNHQRASGVIAKLMGLEETLDAPRSARSHRPDHHTRNDYLSHTSRSISHDLSALQPKDQPTILKTTKPSPRIVPDAAPWKQQNTSTTRYYAKEGPSSASINDDVERRLSNLTSPKCKKELRALRIPRELHVERSDYNARSLNIQKAGQNNNSAQDFQSPVVIMKTARGIMKQNASVATLAGTKVHKQLRHEERPFTMNTDNSDRTKIHSHKQRARSRQEEDVGSTSSPNPCRILSPRLLQKSDRGKITQLIVTQMSPVKTSKEEVSPRGKLRSGASQSNIIYGHDKAMNPESKISLSRQVDTSIINYSNTLNVKTSSIHQSNTTSTSNYEETLILCTDKNIHPLENIRSPVSVLDATFYQDVLSPSLRSISNSFKNAATLTLDECWNSISLPDTATLKKSSESNHIIPENMKDELLLLLTDEAPRTNDKSLIVTANKDRHYIYEILSASGLLHSELNSRMMHCLFQQQSYPINPELFLILEQAKPTAGKLHRKLIFDLANELIAKKIYSGSSVRQPVQFIQCKKSSGWHLFKELCSEIEMLQSEASTIRLSEQEDEERKLAKNVVREMGKWKSFGSELQGMVLDAERSIFKTLIDDVISGEDMGKV